MQSNEMQNRPVIQPIHPPTLLSPQNKAVFDVAGIPKKSESLAMIITSVPKKRRIDVTYGMDALPVLVEFKRAFMTRDFITISQMLEETLEVLAKLTNFCIMREVST